MSDPPESWLELANNALTGYLGGFETIAALDEKRLDEILSILHLVERNLDAAIRATCNIQLDRKGVTVSIRDEIMAAKAHGIWGDRLATFIKKLLEGNGVDANPVWVAKKMGV